MVEKDNFLKLFEKTSNILMKNGNKSVAKKYY